MPGIPPPKRATLHDASLDEPSPNRMRGMLKSVSKGSVNFVARSVLDSFEMLGALSWDLLEACVQNSPPTIKKWASNLVPGAAALVKPPPRKVLVLDLDETLIHSTSRGSRNHDHVIEVLVDRHVCLYYIFKRPHVDFFLEKVSQWYEVVIFTASMAEYADPVVDFLDPDGKLFSRRFFRQVHSAIGCWNANFVVVYAAKFNLSKGPHIGGTRLVKSVFGGQFAHLLCPQCR